MTGDAIEKRDRAMALCKSVSVSRQQCRGFSFRRLCLEMLEERLLPTLLGNQLFPSDNPWNQKITNAPVAANSATLVSSIGLTSSLHADFGAGTYAGSYIGIPFNVVAGTQPGVGIPMVLVSARLAVERIIR